MTTLKQLLLLLITCTALLFATLGASPATASGDYDQLVQLFQEFREMTGAGGDEFGALPVVSPQAISAEADALKRKIVSNDLISLYK